MWGGGGWVVFSAVCLLFLLVFLRLNKVFVWEEGEAALVFQRYLTYYLDLALKTQKRNKQTANKKKNKQTGRSALPLRRLLL